MAPNVVVQTQRRPLRNVRRQRYQEPDTDTDTDTDQDRDRDRNLTRQTTRPSRSSRRLQSYREHSDSSSEDGADSLSSFTTPAADSDIIHHRRSVPSQHQVNVRKRQTQDQPARTHESFNSYKRKKFAQIIPLRDKTNGHSTHIDFPVRERAPLWQSLEYQIWLKILQYAACPIYDHTGRCSASVNWLLELSRLCRTFHDSAIAVLTWAPPLLPSFRAHSLLALLSQSPVALTLNYTTKIHALDIEAKHLLLSKNGIDLETLISKTPLLQHLRIFHPHDDLIGKFIWAKPVFGRDKWAYQNLLELLDQHNIKLQSFEWNGRFRDTIETMLDSASKSCMSTIQDIKLINFVIEDREEVRWGNVRNCTLDSIISLGSLKTLELIHCNIIDADFMSQLPVSLSNLVIADCQSLNSDALQNHLSRGGSSLIKLHLIGNQVMDLGFISSLRECCPNLRDLLIDLTYEDSSSYRDRDPLYDHLLPQGRPSWPTTLQSLVIGPLRSLSVADAEDLYQSLIDAAPELPFLREINMKTLLKDASWRDRAQLRAKWATIFDHVFLINSDEYQSASIPSEPVASVSKESTRKSTRIQELEDVRFSDSISKNDPEMSGILDGLPRHNRCERIVFELSDQRPAQEQYREQDFLDDELSGDEEWHEGR